MTALRANPHVAIARSRDAAKKRNLFRQPAGAIAVDMESAAIAEAAPTARIPCAVVCRTISDSAQPIFRRPRGGLLSGRSRLVAAALRRGHSPSVALGESGYSPSTRLAAGISPRRWIR